MKIDDKRGRAQLFRTRLQGAMTTQGSTQSGLARAIGVDRSTISQLLTGDGARLPNAQVVAGCAAALGVSADWLLGLTDRPERAADLVAAAIEMTQAPRALIDEQVFEFSSFAAGSGYYEGVPKGLRAAQLDHMLSLHNDLYPTLRVHLFDARRLYSAPVTVFGPLLAVLYLGQTYLAFRDTERVQFMTRHFDLLVREATITPRDLPAHIDALRTEYL